jgi:hypothetical protein
MIDYYLRADTAEVLQSALDTLPSDVTIDAIGVMYRVLDDGESVEAVPGYHANVRSNTPIAWPPGVVSLNLHSPWRVFA